MRNVMLTICLLVLLIAGCASTNNQTATPAAERYYKALKILFQEGGPFNKEIHAEIEYQKYLKQKEGSVK